jgi:hypothetical protein
LNIDLPLALKVAGVGQVLVACLNLMLVPMMQWRAELAKIPLLIREVFQVHLWFISVTLLIFGVVTWRFSPEMASGTHAMAAWLCTGIGFFWALRSILQVIYLQQQPLAWAAESDRDPYLSAAGLCRVKRDVRDCSGAIFLDAFYLLRRP